MFSQSFSFPHPVLGSNDDIRGCFEVALKVQRNNQKRSLRFYDIEYKIENEYIQDLIKTGKAGTLFKIYCSSTFRTWTFSDPLSFELDENSLYNKIEIDVYLVTKKEIPHFSHSSFNHHFHQYSFSLDKNEIIGLSGKVIMKIEKNDEKLGLGNIFKFFSHQEKKPIEFTYSQDKIHIYYPKDGESHPPNSIFAAYPWTAYNLFIVPALTGAFQYACKTPEEDLEGLEWYTIINNIFPKEEWREDSYANAQLFLKNKMPILKSHQELID